MGEINKYDSNGLRHGLWITERQIHPRIKNKYNRINPRIKGNINIVDVIHNFYIHGILNGTSKVFREDELIYSCNYKNGLWDGREMRFKHYVTSYKIELCCWVEEIYEGETLEIELENNYLEKLK